MCAEDYGFDTDFMTDDEVEQVLDSIVLSIGELVANEDSKVAIANPDRIQYVLCTYKIMKYLFNKNSGVKVSYQLHKPFKSMGSVTLTGKQITFKKPDWFLRAVALANNFEVYPKTDGTVEMNFTFHDLTVPLE